MDFQEIPEEWGIHVVRSGHFQKVKKSDLEALRELRERFRDGYDGRPIPNKEELQMRGNTWLKATLNRLWGAGFVEKFATTFHTLSGRPNYTSWYIWEDSYRFKYNSKVPQFIVED